ncbi:hypothetical protein [Microbacterium hibisci]|uniref:hypothetical protein n=1 Tax=Microbacterium hibisci TaxID=2036000 RepID=UPI00194504F8|nr:hypothetical protein [Microbacterium hibisci]
MNLILEPSSADPPTLQRSTAVRLVAAAPSLWRVVDPRGLVIGHLQAHTQAGGIRYRARRFHAASRAFRELGEFWSADDALECLRLAH